MAPTQPITPLRQRMLDDMKLRNMAESVRLTPPGAAPVAVVTLRWQRNAMAAVRRSDRSCGRRSGSAHR